MINQINRYLIYLAFIFYSCISSAISGLEYGSSFDFPNQTGGNSSGNSIGKVSSRSSSLEILYRAEEQSRFLFSFGYYHWDGSYEKFLNTTSTGESYTATDNSYLIKCGYIFSPIDDKSVIAFAGLMAGFTNYEFRKVDISASKNTYLSYGLQAGAHFNFLQDEMIKPYFKLGASYIFTNTGDISIDGLSIQKSLAGLDGLKILISIGFWY